LANTGIKGPVDVSACKVFTVHLVGIAGGGSVTIEASSDDGSTWIAQGAARTADVAVDFSTLWDAIRVNVGTAKAGAKAYIKRMVENEAF
jgi:hypothetical protein